MFTPPHNMQDASSRSSPAAVEIPFSTSMSTTPSQHMQSTSSRSSSTPIGIPFFTPMSIPVQDMQSSSSPSSPAHVNIPSSTSTLTQQTPYPSWLPLSNEVPHAPPRPEFPLSKQADLTEHMSNTMDRILDTLRRPTIAEERGEDVESKFWATYKKVSNEHDNDFLERANGDMGIILTFAGLFSAVNSTFIIGMQPNPGDTTNNLLLHLIQITANGPNSVPDISSLSSSTGYSSSKVWIQTLAYASLAFSVLAAFGAVMGKQWLNSYKAAQGQGNLEECGIQRQMKLDGLVYFHLQTVLQAFLVLLQISLLLFGFSLSAYLWTQQTTISSVIISTTAFGVLFYTGTIVVSVWRPDSPFQTPGSKLAAAVCKNVLPALARTIFKSHSQISQQPELSKAPSEAPQSTLAMPLLTTKSRAARAICETILPDTRRSNLHNILGKSSAIRWILEGSTNPEVVEVAAAMVPLVQWPPKLDASAAYARLRDNFMACHASEELSVMYIKAMAHLCSQSVKIDPGLLWRNRNTRHLWGGRSRFIRDAFMAGHHAYRQLQSASQDDNKRMHQADARTALRTMVVHGLEDELSPPENEKLIWDGDLYWVRANRRPPSCEEFDWVIDYLANDENGLKTDDETEGDALLVLSAMDGLGSSDKRPSYIRALVRCIGPTRPPRVRHAALRTVFGARRELASITSDSMPHGVDAQLLDELSFALLTAACPNRDQTIHGTGLDATFHDNRDSCYISLMFALTQHDEWCQRLARDGHLERCIALVDEACNRNWDERGYLPAIFGRIDPSGKELPFSPAQENWRKLIQKSWHKSHIDLWSDDYVDAILALVTTTKQNWPSSDNIVPREWLVELATEVHTTLGYLQVRGERRAGDVNDGVAQVTVDTAISSVQRLYDDLSYMIEHRKAPRKDTGYLVS